MSMNVFDPTKGFNAFAQGAQIGGVIRQAKTDRMAAPAIAQGNYGQAADIYGQRGDAAGADVYRAQYETQLAGLSAAEKEAAKLEADQLARFAVSVRAMPDPAQRQQAYTQAMPMLQGMGLNVEEMGEFYQNNDALDLVIGQARSLEDILKGPKFTAPVPVTGPDGKQTFAQFNDQGTAPTTFDGFTPPAEAPSYKQVETADGIYEYIEGQPDSMRFIGKAPAKASAGGGAGEYGLSPIYGRDAEGNRVLIQTNKAGGVRQADIPEGVTLEDDYYKSFDSALGKEDAKKAAYEGTAGVAILAAEAKANEILTQIDTAMEQTNWMNTGFLGRMVFAGNLDATLDAIGAKAMLAELVAIKAQGGTLGALSDAEGKALRDAAVAVSRSQSEKQLDANLRAYRLQVETSMMRMKQAFEAEYVKDTPRPRPRGGGAGQGGGGGSAAPTQTATNPQTGEKLGLVNGEWVPIQ